jgi:hypothetical protein
MLFGRLTLSISRGNVSRQLRQQIQFGLIQKGFIFVVTILPVELSTFLPFLG